MILVDTSVWVDHLRGSESELSEHLDTGNVLMPPMILGAIACGNLLNRTETLQNLNALPRIDTQEDQKILSLIDSRLLMGLGIGYIDAQFDWFCAESSGHVSVDSGSTVEASCRRTRGCIPRKTPLTAI